MFDTFFKHKILFPIITHFYGFRIHWFFKRTPNHKESTEDQHMKISISIFQYIDYPVSELAEYISATILATTPTLKIP